ncbi:hypothetical protein M9434_002617 [Picochlorum sp. BPE23]|nr:hypothetical protein M9435_006855 [Picochlorum sp. BPE23]KAI8114495.1 hypothetical protein M9434_002617 [Picochlorum sp. BPE23]
MGQDPEKKKKRKSKKSSKEKKERKEKRSKVETPQPLAAKVKHAGGEKMLALVGNRQLAAESKPIIKDLYTESEEVRNLANPEVSEFRETRRIAVKNCDIKPIAKFAHSNLSDDELYAVRNFSTPSPIQSQCLPIALSGRDLVGIAATGSGKTLAFGLPAIKHIQAQVDAGLVSGRSPVALVLAPTRELAQQIGSVLEDAGQKVGIRCACLFGGVPKRDQAKIMKSGVSIVVATPGRLEDMIGDGTCSLSEVSYLVLDEADRMLDLGFEPHIRSICENIRADRQTLMFSATWPSSIQKLASEFLCDPARVTVGSEELSASHTVKQIVQVVEHGLRDRLLDDLLKKYHASRKNRVLVFVLYKKEAVRVESLLQRRGWNTAAVHGDISQAQRTAAVSSFKSGEIPLLVATDVAARGLDIPNVEVVINYSFPLTIEDYVHRIGRTGRAGKSGISHTMFVGARDKPRAGELINVLSEANQKVPEELLAFGTTVKKKESKVYGAHFREVDFTQKATKVTFDSDSE